MKKTPEYLDADKSILFLGSGFSSSARNIRGDFMPTGTDLKRRLAKVLNVSESSYDLTTIASEVASNSDINIYQLMYETFTTLSPSEEQLALLTYPWLRIYTTNYDDIIEHSYRQLQKPIYSFSYDENKPRKIFPGSIIHLHGSIRDINEDNVNDHLILNEQSYVRQSFQHSVWYDEFTRDLRFCTNCFFVGYSLADYHISALLMQANLIKHKVYFITNKPDNIFTNRTQDYGTVLPIQLAGFTKLLDQLPKRTKKLNLNNLKVFKHINPYKDNKALSDPTSNEIANLITYGTFNEHRCMSSLPEPKYVIPRKEKSNEALLALENAKTLLVHSKLGNGKTVFLYILAHKLSQQGYMCFRCKESTELLIPELELLKSYEKIAIFFESYDTAIETIKTIEQHTPQAKYIIEVRTGIQEVRLHEIHDRFPTPISRFDLNQLSTIEKNDFIQVLDKAGLLGRTENRTIEECHDLREIVVALYNNREIKTKLEKEIEPLLRDRITSTIIISSHILRWIGHDSNSAFLRVVTGNDAYAEVAKFKETALDIFIFSENEFRAQSALFSEFMIDNYFQPNDVIQIISSMITEALKRREDRSFRAISSKLMQVSVLKRILKNHIESESSIRSLFNTLQNNNNVNNEPLFWLQYSILMMDIGDLGIAEKFIETAYNRASKKQGFKTYQIDTHALRLFLKAEIISQEKRVVRFNDIIDLLEKVSSMTLEDSHRDFALRVIVDIEPFVQSRLSSFNSFEINTLLIQLNRLNSNVSQLQSRHADFETNIESRNALASVQSAISTLSKHLKLSQ
ncbi:MAG: SIR2 family protein [Rhodothermales bacterium]